MLFEVFVRFEKEPSSALRAHRSRSGQIVRSDLINVIGILDLARNRTENRRPLFLIARLPTLRAGEGKVKERV